MPECEEAYTNREEKEETEMKVLKKITDFVSRYMAAIVILMALVALFAPSTVSFIKTSYVNTLLGIVMFGMGLTSNLATLRLCSAVRRMLSLDVLHNSPLCHCWHLD